jgi:hypothetical protein
MQDDMAADALEPDVRFVKALCKGLNAFACLVHCRFDAHMNVSDEPLYLTDPLNVWDLWENMNVVERGVESAERPWKTADIAEAYAMFKHVFPTLCQHIAMEESPRWRFLNFLSPICSALQRRIYGNPANVITDRVVGGLLSRADPEYFAVAMADATANERYFVDYGIHCAREAAAILTAWKRDTLRVALEYYADHGDFGDLANAGLKVTHLTFLRDPKLLVDPTIGFHIVVQMPPGDNDDDDHDKPSRIDQLTLSAGSSSSQKRVFRSVSGASNFVKVFFIEEPEQIYYMDEHVVGPTTRIPSLFEIAFGHVLAAWHTLSPEKRRELGTFFDMRIEGERVARKRQMEDTLDRTRANKIPRLDSFYL